MARNHSEDHPESGSHSGGDTSAPSMYSTSTPSSPAAHGTLGANGLTSADMDLTGMGEASAGNPSPAREAARAAQQSATKTASRSTGDAPSPTSMAKKRGNQPR